MNLDAANLNIEQLGLDIIKEQQAANLHFSSDQSALIPEDRAQVMLTSVSILVLIFPHLNVLIFQMSLFKRSNVQLLIVPISCRPCRCFKWWGFWRYKPLNFDKMPFDSH